MTKELILTVVVRKELGRFSSWCPELDIASQGDTIEEARENLREAVDVFIETIIEDGRAEELWERLGLTREDVEKKVILMPESFSGSFEIPVEV